MRVVGGGKIYIKGKLDVLKHDEQISQKHAWHVSISSGANCQQIEEYIIKYSPEDGDVVVCSIYFKPGIQI